MFRAGLKFSILFVSVLIAACGGGSGGSAPELDIDLSGNNAGGGSTEPPPPATLTGAFVDSAVQGLHYQTATQSGLTNSAGEFKYAAGETVTFSIGGIVLGSAPGDDIVTPFDLFNMSVPSAEREVRDLLRPRGEVSDLEKVANIALLLVALDNDNNPDNGLDLTGWHEALEDASLDFNKKLKTFHEYTFRHFAVRWGVFNQIPVTLPLAHLYNTVGVEVTAHAVTGSNLNPSTTTYTDIGLVQAERVELPFNQDKTYRYDALHRVTSETERMYSPGTDIPLSDTERSYTFDMHGRRTLTIANMDYNLDGVTDQRAETQHSYTDASGLPHQELGEVDNELDGSIDQTSTVTHNYDASGNQIYQERVTRAYPDGTIFIKYTETSSYNADGFALTNIYTTDHASGSSMSSADGIDDEIFDTTLIYDTQNNPLSVLSRSNINFAGTGTHHRTQSLITYQRDQQGYLLQEMSEFGTLSSSDDFTVNIIGKTVYTRDHLGRLLTATIYRDGHSDVYGTTPQDGTIDSVERITHNYSPDGYVISQLNEVDADNDGTFESDVITTWNYLKLDNGIAYLINDI